MPVLLLEFGSLDEPEVLHVFSMSAELMDRFITHATDMLNAEEVCVEAVRILTGGPRHMPLCRIQTEPLHKHKKVGRIESLFSKTRRKSVGHSSDSVAIKTTSAPSPTVM